MAFLRIKTDSRKIVSQVWEWLEKADLGEHPHTTVTDYGGLWLF